ncbi:MAG: xerD 1 [Gemmataceae bacterium]|nr:xerD 1 [Gemmataceae bacterium]
MAHLVRQKKTYYVDVAGKRVPRGTPGAKKVREKLAKWYGASIPGMGKKRVPLATDKRVAQKLLDDMMQRAERGLALMPDLSEAGQALGPLVEEFGGTVARKAKEKHTKAVTGDVRKVLAGRQLITLSDLRAKDLAARVESFVWSLVEGEDAVGPATAAYVGKHARSFTRWLWRKRRLLDFDPLAGMDLPSQETQQHRRALSAEELAALIDATDASTKAFRFLAGPDRAVLYLVAVATSYRSGELAKLTPAYFDLDADIPVVRLKGRHTKNKKPAEQPLPPAVVSRLRAYLAERPEAEPVWPGTWSERSADMLKADLTAAGVPLLVDDESALFHSLRHTYTTLLARSAPVKVTQELARHSTTVLTLGRYAHASMKEKAEAVAALPLPGAAVPTGPFAGMTRADLERVAEMLLVSLIASLGRAGDTPRDTHEVESGRDSGG